MLGAGQQLPARLPARPEAGAAAPGRGLCFAAVAGALHHLGARGTRAWVAQEQAVVSAGGLQFPRAGLAARVRHQPGVVFGVHLLATEAAIHVQSLPAAVVLATLWAVPLQLFFAHSFLLLLLLLLLKHAVLGPFLHTGEVKNTVAGTTGPDPLSSLHIFNANKAHHGARYKVVGQKLDGPLKVTRSFVTQFRIGANNARQDSLSFKLFFRRRLVVLSRRQEFLHVRLYFGAGFFELPADRRRRMLRVGVSVRDSRRSCRCASSLWLQRHTPGIAAALGLVSALASTSTSATTGGTGLIHDERAAHRHLLAEIRPRWHSGQSNVRTRKQRKR